jgi:prepilin-type N-terminal cleavage/methylation domain-containing protein
MHQGRGFTIVEFVIAVAISAILGGIAVARYNSYERVQAFQRVGTGVASCLERASQRARSGAEAGAYRFVRASVVMGVSAGGDATTSCTVDTFSQYTGSTLQTATSLVDTVPVPSDPKPLVTGSAVGYWNTTTFGAQVYRFVFGTLEQGVLIAWSHGATHNAAGTMVAQPDASGSGGYVPRGTGVALAASELVLTSQADTSASGYITLPASGSPAKFITQ